MAASPVSAKTITFDDLGGPGPGVGEIPENYEGLSWGGHTYWQHDFDQYILDTYGITTGFMAGTTVWSENNINFQIPGVTSLSTAHFDFISAELAGRYGSLPVKVTGWNLVNGQWEAAYEEDIDVTMSHQLYTFDFYGIERLTAVSLGYASVNPNASGSHISMDNIEVNLVPEPISSVLFLTGGMLFAGRGFLRKRGRA